jgi:hypothetical protein
MEREIGGIIMDGRRPGRSRLPEGKVGIVVRDIMWMMLLLVLLPQSVIVSILLGGKRDVSVSRNRVKRHGEKLR